MTLSAMGMYRDLPCLGDCRGGFAQICVGGLAGCPIEAPCRCAVLAWYFGSVVFISVTVWYLASRLANALRQREAELAASNRRLVAATEERARYMLRTTHELKAPFAAIHANTQLLLGGYCGTLPAPAVAVIEQIATRCEMLSRGIKAMLQLANLRSTAQTTPLPCPVDLPALIRSCLATLKPQAAKRGIVLEDDLLPATVEVVQDHAVMIIENILSNAINYSQDGQRVLVSCRATPDGGATVVVRDYGIGIPPDKLPQNLRRLFPHQRSRQAQQCIDRPGLGHRPRDGLGRQDRRVVWRAPRARHGLFSRFPRFTRQLRDAQLTRRNAHGISTDRG